MRGAAGIGVCDLIANGRGHRGGVDEALERSSHVDAIMVDFDIDVIDRASVRARQERGQGGCRSAISSRAARRLAEEERVRLVDLTEFDPGLDPHDHQRLDGRALGCEVLAGLRGAR
jgi:formiminoglutamase